MTTQTVHDADTAIKIAPLPKWHTAIGFERDTLGDFPDGKFTVLDTAPLVNYATASVSIEWQTVVNSDGTVSPPLEAFKITADDDEMFIDTRNVRRLISAICNAATKAGVAIL